MTGPVVRICAPKGPWASCPPRSPICKLLDILPRLENDFSLFAIAAILSDSLDAFAENL